MFGSGSIVGNDDPLGGQGHNGVRGGGGLLVTVGLLVAAGPAQGQHSAFSTWPRCHKGRDQVEKVVCCCKARCQHNRGRRLN